MTGPGSMSVSRLIATLDQVHNLSAMDSDQKFKWPLLVVDCMKQLRAEGLRFVDQEVIPNFDGTPNEISAWFICSIMIRENDSICRQQRKR